MRRPLSYFILCSLLLGECADVRAIAVDNYNVATNSPSTAGYALSFDHIYNYKRSSAVAVDHYWLLTAAHVGDDANSWSNLTINGETYTEQEVVLHPDADLALVRYDKALPGYYLLMEDEIFHKKKSGWSTTTVWHELLMAGFGYAGTVSSSSFTQGGTQWIKRWGTNRGESEATKNYDAGGAAGNRSSTCIHVDFDLNDTDYEAGGNVYDSGGGVFATNSVGDWVLAGINVLRSGSNPYTGNDAVKVADYVSWIKSVIVDYDTDKDFLPDWWETLYGSGPTSMDAAADLDGDDFPNYTEWIADTDPTNGASHFIIFEWLAPTNVTFSSSMDRQYLIEYRVDLVDTNAAWQTEVDWFDGSNSQTVQNVTGPTSNRFYRIRAKLR